MKNVLGVVCLSLGLTVAAVAGELKTVGVSGTSNPAAVTIPAGQMMRILTCVYDGIDSINGIPASPTLTFTPSGQSQGADLHATILKQLLQQDLQGFYLVGPAKVTFTGKSATGFFVNYEMLSSTR
ncbi:MAG: hypothetical protein WAM82_10600 [Thermoanaerobaculia bacterium]